MVQNIAFDCADPYALAQFWSKVVNTPLNDDDHPGDPEASILMPNGVALFFNRVLEPKAVKNRVHVCLRPTTARDAEVDRLLSSGARMLHDRRNGDGTGWAVLTDPEGNEFCVLRSADEFAAGH